VEAIKDIAVLALLVFMFKKRIQIGHVFFTCAFLFGILHHMSPVELGSAIITALVSGSSLTLFTALYLITLLEKTMRHSGSQSRLVSGLMNLSGDPRIPMAALPAIIGLLPSPGGARFSAPLVAEASKGIQLTGEQNAAINYYYRHLWEFFLPLYPASLLAVEILEVPLGRFILVMLPFTVITVFAGLFLYRDLPSSQTAADTQQDNQAWKQVVEGLSPIAAIMILVLVFDLHILLSLVSVITFMFFYYRIGIKQIGLMLVSALEVRLLYMVFGAIYLREVLVQSGSIEQLLGYFQDMGLSPLLIAIIFPAIIGLLTGVTIAGVSIALPVIVTLATPDNILSLGSLAIASNIAGQMLSPMHLCLLMSVEHFSADFTGTYARLILPEALLIIFAIIYSTMLPF